MCTSIIEIARAEGMAKREDEWFPLSHCVVAYDHARHAPLGDVITLDFVNTGLDAGARALLSELVTEVVRRGASVVFSSHESDVAVAMSDRLVTMAGGRVADVTAGGRRAKLSAVNEGDSHVA